MDMVHGYWEENANLHRVKYESCNSNDEQSRLKEDKSFYPCCDGNLNFATAACSEDDSEYGPYKKNKVTRQDPMSHRIIEKRRRDRMNNCLADLSRLIPTEYLKKGRGRIEKTEIIEMAIKHMKYLQQEHGNPSEHYRLGYQECMSETMRFMVEVEGHFPREAICVRLLNHLQKHCDSLSRAAPVQPPPATTLVALHNRDIVDISPQLQPKDYTSARCNPEVNNNNTMCNGRTRNNSESEMCEKHTDGNGVSYKYKTDIKLRFNQDLNAVERSAKRQKVDNCRRNSITSLENHSSSHSSPPSSEPYTRNSSESEHNHRNSPSESSVSGNPKSDSAPSIDRGFTNGVKTPHHSSIGTLDIKTNFSVPVFVLHAKGSFYVPLTIDYKALLPYLHNYDLLEVIPGVHNVVLHPVTINVNFQPSFGIKNGGNWN